MKTLVSLVVAATAALAAVTQTDAGPTGAAQAPARAWKLDPVHSSVVFKVKHAGASWFYGTFAAISGELEFDPSEPAGGAVELMIDATSVDTRDEKRDQHLMSPDFFDAKQYPEITFRSAKITGTADRFTVAGELTMRGVAKPLSITVEKTGEGEFYGKRIGYETTFTVERSDFGMEYGLAKEVVGDEVTLTIAIEALAADDK